MKTLSNYTQDAQTKLFERTGAFFAFSNRQFAEAKKAGVTYCSLGAGMIVPKENARVLVDALEKIQQEGIQLDIKENSKEAIIRRELFNYECFYTGDIEDCVDSLKDYGIERKEISSAFNHIRATEDIDL